MVYTQVTMTNIPINPEAYVHDQRNAIEIPAKGMDR